MESSSPKTWYLLGGVLLAGFSALCVGAVAVFLASSGSDYMNGESFAIDGGGLAGGVAPTGYAPEIPLEI